MTSNFRPGRKARHWGAERVVRAEGWGQAGHGWDRKEGSSLTSGWGSSRGPVRDAPSGGGCGGGPEKGGWGTLVAVRTPTLPSDLPDILSAPSPAGYGLCPHLVPSSAASGCSWLAPHVSSLGLPISPRPVAAPTSPLQTLSQALLPSQLIGASRLPPHPASARSPQTCVRSLHLLPS